MSATLTHRLARREELDELRALMDLAIGELQKPFLSNDQIASSRTIMGLDTQLIDDGTYFVIEQDGELAGCGGWSRRATLYGGNQTPGRDAALLDPAREAARAEGFKSVELMATASGEPLYLACGYQPGERLTDDRGGTPAPPMRMRKPI